jgi:hypothetical protein
MGRKTGWQSRKEQERGTVSSLSGPTSRPAAPADAYNQDCPFKKAVSHGISKYLPW